MIGPKPLSVATWLAIRRALAGENSDDRLTYTRQAVEAWLRTLADLEGPRVAAGLAYALADELVT